MARHVWAGLVLSLALAARAVAGPFGAADIIVANQLPDGSWGYPEWETGYMIPGLVRAYEMSWYTPYRASAELAGMYVLNHAPLIGDLLGDFSGVSTNPYNTQPFPNGSYDGTPQSATTHDLLGQEAYGFARLSQVNATNPSANIWRSEITNFYTDVNALFPVYPATGNNSTLGYIEHLRDAQYNWFDPSYQPDYSIATVMLASHVMAADYVGAADLAVWRQGLIDTLGKVDDNRSFPVMALGAALWALASTEGGLDNVTPISTDPASVFYMMMTDELPDFLASFQDFDDPDRPGSFYWRFDKDGDPAYGYVEDTVYGVLGLQAATENGYGVYDLEVLAGQYAVLHGFAYWEGYMREHLWFSFYEGYNFMYAAVGLQVLVPEPGSLLLLAGGLGGLVLKRRRRAAQRAVGGRRRIGVPLAAIVLACGGLGGASAAAGEGLPGRVGDAEALAFDPFSLVTDTKLLSSYQSALSSGRVAKVVAPRPKSTARSDPAPSTTVAPSGSTESTSAPAPSEATASDDGSETISLATPTLLINPRPPKQTPVLPPWP